MAMLLINFKSEYEILERRYDYIRIRMKIGMSVGGLFEFMESQKAVVGIDNYSVCVASLEQIFSQFVEKSA